MKLAAFDLEIAKQLPEDVDDILRYAPLGITCAAVALQDGDEPHVWKGVSQLSVTECQSIVRYLQGIVSSGYTLITWNGCAFDFRVLAQESGLAEECGELALNHVDLMLLVTFTKGYYLALDKALKGAGLEGKKKRVKLSDGTIINDMSGAQAPRMWAAGEYDAVLEYLRDDVTQLLSLAEFTQRTKAINWRSNKGNAQAATVSRMMTVREAFTLPEPDVSWMDSPPKRQQFVDWIPQWQSPSTSRRSVGPRKSQASTSPQEERATKEIEDKPSTSNVRGCLFSIAVFFLLMILLVILTTLITNDTVVFCATLATLLLSLAAFPYFRVKSNTVRRLFRRT